LAKNTWIFGYGSLIWRPDFEYLESHSATLHDWRRVFWQGSHDHRGSVAAPGRVVTLVPSTGYSCVGKIYLIDNNVAKSTFATLDHREKNGYDRLEADFVLADQRIIRGIVYIANANNEAYLGEAPLDVIANQIAVSHGPSGSNTEYALELANALRVLEADDEHVFAIEQLLLKNHTKV